MVSLHHYQVVVDIKFSAEWPIAMGSWSDSIVAISQRSMVLKKSICD